MYKKIFLVFSSVTLFVILATQLVGNVKALFYANPTSKIPESGYLIIKLYTGEYMQCGINYLSDSLGVTAAHCLRGAEAVYPMTGTYKRNAWKNAPKVSKFSTSPKYQDYIGGLTPGKADVGIIKLKDRVQLPEYTKIASPSEGCGYYIVGYGQDENGNTLERDGLDVCIKNITTYSFELTFPGKSSFCYGDSGSGIYKKDTNEIVGVVSRFYSPIGMEGCQYGTAFVATRLDDNADYIFSNEQDFAYSSPTPTTYLSTPYNTPTSTPYYTPTPFPTFPKITTVPEDYFGNLHPETQKKDGTYNYNDEILLQVEKLGEIFDQIYPEDPTSSKTPSNTSPTPTIEYAYIQSPTPTIGNQRISNSPTQVLDGNAEQDDGSNVGGLMLLIPVVVFVLFIVSLIALIKMITKKPTTNTTPPINQTNPQQPRTNSEPEQLSSQ